WDDPDAALAGYLEQKDALHSGRSPRPNPGALTVKDAANAFLNHKAALLGNGELSCRAWQDARETCDTLVFHFGKHRLVAARPPADFARLREKMSQRWGPVRLGNVIGRVRSVFKHALESALLTAPVCFGPSFKRPSAKVLRLARVKAGPKLFTAEEV